MAKYEWRIVFDADDDEEAKQIVYDERHGASQAFHSIHDDNLTHEDGSEVK